MLLTDFLCFQAWGAHDEVAALLLAKGVKHDMHSAAGFGQVAALTKLLDEGEDIEAERVEYVRRHTVISRDVSERLLVDTAVAPRCTGWEHK